MACSVLQVSNNDYVLFGPESNKSNKLESALFGKPLLPSIHGVSPRSECLLTHVFDCDNINITIIRRMKNRENDLKLIWEMVAIVVRSEVLLGGNDLYFDSILPCEYAKIWQI